MHFAEVSLVQLGWSLVQCRWFAYRITQEISQKRVSRCCTIIKLVRIILVAVSYVALFDICTLQTAADCPIGDFQSAARWPTGRRFLCLFGLDVGATKSVLELYPINLFKAGHITKACVGPVQKGPKAKASLQFAFWQMKLCRCCSFWRKIDRQ